MSDPSVRREATASADHVPHVDVIRRHLLDSAEVKRQAADRCAADIERAAKLVAECLRNGGRLLLCGNGGSAADSQHIAAEFTSTLRRDIVRPALAAIALTTDTSFLTARANDFGFDDVFARQVEALGRFGDVLIGISTSGKSVNVIRAAARAKTLGMSTIGLTGAAGGGVGDNADVAIRIPSTDVQHVQEAHIAVGHVLCLLCEEILFGDGRR